MMIISDIIQVIKTTQVFNQPKRPPGAPFVPFIFSVSTDPPETTGNLSSFVREATFKPLRMLRLSTSLGPEHEPSGGFHWAKKASGEKRFWLGGF